MTKDIDLIECLQFVPVSQMSYQEWVNVGMILKDEGYSWTDWDAWSQRDSRYHPGECKRKWETFKGSSDPVTAGTIIKLASENGWRSYNTEDKDFALNWDSIIGSKREIPIKTTTTEEAAPQIIRYLETLFKDSDIVGYVTETYQHEGTFSPKKGCYVRTAGEIIKALKKVKNDDIGAVLGDYNEDVGAWIRFNPLDGKGVMNENVVNFKYALVESDKESLERQNAIMRNLELPIACLVYSGGKSLHAIVRIDAADKEDYRKKVNFLYDVCRKSGLDVDTQNKNPSRLSRLPGIKRGEKRQTLLETNIGKKSFEEWKAWIEATNDNLPQPESLSSVWDDLPARADALIENVLLKGHKMLVAGPSKAGKSFALIELCCALAEGKEWLGLKCQQGKVLYVNLEIDRASCFHRFKDVYTSLGWKPENLQNIDIWNLRGKSLPMDKLAPKIILRAAKKQYVAIIIDPIYKVITGDENSADQMSFFCNQFDKICTELKCAVIYCHHHSKGPQGDKFSIDRASGSGVFARDPDAFLDLSELIDTKKIKEQEFNNEACTAIYDYINDVAPELKKDIPQDDRYNHKKLLEFVENNLSTPDVRTIYDLIKKMKENVNSYTAWRLEGVLREFPRLSPVNLWFKYPTHQIDNSGVLDDLAISNSKNSPWNQNFGKKKSTEERKEESQKAFEIAFQACACNNIASVSDVAEYLGLTEKTVQNRIKSSDKFWYDKKNFGLKQIG